MTKLSYVLRIVIVDFVLFVLDSEALVQSYLDVLIVGEVVEVVVEVREDERQAYTT